MSSSTPPSDLACMQCAVEGPLSFDFTMAFQPIVDVEKRTVYAYEALVRGIEGESAPSILGRVDRSNRYRFDQACRVKAIELAARLGMKSCLSINFLPHAVYSPEACIQTTLRTARQQDFPLDNIIFEVGESERLDNRRHLVNIFRTYREMGFKTAIDDFGSGYSDLGLLAEFQPNIVKADMSLIRAIDSDRVRKVILRSLQQACRDLDCLLIAEGIETKEEYKALADMGITLQQGFYFARPGFQSLPAVEDSLFVAGDAVQSK